MLGGWRQVNRSVLAAIGVPVAVTVGSVGTFWLASPSASRAPVRHHHAAIQAAPAASASASPTPSPSPAKPKAHKHPGQHPGHKRAPAPPAAAPSGLLPGHVFVGVAVGTQITPSVDSFSAATGAHMALVELYTGFGSPFPQPGAGRVTALGSTPLIQWDPGRAPLGTIAAGGYDGYVRQWAAAARAFGHHIVLSFGHEMNGPWSRWGSAHATPAQFVAAWRRIHTIFASQHVGNVTWSWDPSHTGADPQPWWPGPGYVDEIGIDGYFRPGQTFAQIFAQRLALIRSFTGKPVFIAETSVAPSPGAPGQIVGLFNGVIHYGLMGFVWFDINGLEQWRLEGRLAAIAAFRMCVAHTQ
jgi:hypothetical protein